ncbi:MAG: adenosylcobinamide-phosphate synthase CbiB [Actinomycetota bacterium]|nr:adenosylcobinamide-phosphate synthase CbiB [Actinomycetota bacterium]MCL6093589.1 adenosylcobinamide-phosphate synthase CbiB [Actinomycetota bacterium]MDA8166144.1 adenosylcobinamide-phosphate synthase CbiB [Actinomycetota bacterium]
MPAWPDGNGAGARLCLAFAADACFGEPPLQCHPVYWMGKLVDLADWGMPGRERGPAAERIAGTVVALALPAGTYLATAWLLQSVPRRLRRTAEVMLLSFALAGRSLYESAGDVQRGLAKSEEEGRDRVSRMVGRDTHSLDEAGITRAAIESVAENCNDGVVAPVFYGLIGGAPLALAYKMVSTLDSMIGYRNLRYGNFGWASARLDDAAGFIPARLTAAAASLAGPLVGGSTAGALGSWRRDAAAHASPNAGVCESAFAGALGVCLGGGNRYGDIPVDTPLMGKGLREPAWEDIGRAANLMYVASTLVLMFGAVLRWMLRGWRRA